MNHFCYFKVRWFSRQNVFTDSLLWPCTQYYLPTMFLNSPYIPSNLAILFLKQFCLCTWLYPDYSLIFDPPTLWNCGHSLRYFSYDITLISWVSIKPSFLCTLKALVYILLFCILWVKPCVGPKLGSEVWLPGFKSLLWSPLLLQF